MPETSITLQFASEAEALAFLSSLNTPAVQPQAASSTDPGQPAATAPADPLAIPEFLRRTAGPPATPAVPPTGPVPQAAPVGVPAGPVPQAAPVGVPAGPVPQAAPVGVPAGPVPQAAPVGVPMQAAPAEDGPCSEQTFSEMRATLTNMVQVLGPAGANAINEVMAQHGISEAAQATEMKARAVIETARQRMAQGS